VFPSSHVLAELARRLGVDLNYLSEALSDQSEIYNLFHQARGCMEQGQYEAALELLLLLLGQPPMIRRTEMILLDIATCYEQLGDMKKCSETWERLVQVVLERGDIPAAIGYYYRLGNVYRRQEQAALAKLYWDRAVAMLERHPDIYMPLALKLYANLARVNVVFAGYSASERAYLKAAQIAKEVDAEMDLVMIEHGLSNVYLEQGRQEEAEAWTKRALAHYEALKHSRGINQCRINLAVIDLLRSAPQRAVDRLTEWMAAPEMQSDHFRLAKAYAVRGEAFAQMGQFDRALADGLSANELPREPQVETCIYHLLATTYQALGRLDEALLFASRAIESADRRQDFTWMTKTRNTRRSITLSKNRKTETVTP
jgi:tetratricopeptide (TPR) repeat protein